MTRVTKSARGIGFRRPIIVKADPRAPVTGDAAAGTRRLRRLSRPGHFNITDLGETSLVIDFALFTDTTTRVVRRAKAKRGTTPVDKIDEQLQRGAATEQSCVYLDFDEECGEFLVSEYVIRLPTPGEDLEHKHVAEDVAALLEEISPPTPKTNVWVRQKVDALGGNISSVRRGRSELIDGLNAPYPHIGGDDVSVSLPTLAEFIAELKPAYADAFNPDAPLA